MLIVRRLIALFILLCPIFSQAELLVGLGKADITPPTGTPSAGYAARKGGMEGVHDPLQAIALFIDNGDKKIVLCSVDNLGFTYEMAERIRAQVQSQPGLAQCQIYIGSSHTHAGGGAFLAIPRVGEFLAGPYQPELAKWYEDQTAHAIISSTQNPIEALIGVGYGKAEQLNSYRSLWPEGVSPLEDLSIIKVTKTDGTPFALLFNFPMHPTVLDSQNRLFSADFVGYARNHIQSLIGKEVQPLYFNGAQAEILPIIANENDRYQSCDLLGKSLAKAVEEVWKKTVANDSFQIDTHREIYSFTPQPTPQGLSIPIDSYKSELNLLVFNQTHAFLTMPGELSCLYDRRFKEMGRKLGYQQVSIFGLTNDAHGYILLPEAWQKKTYESNLSFGGEHYGDQIEQKVSLLLQISSD
jgi:hypothetical protein